MEQYGTSNPPDFYREGEHYNELGNEADERRGAVEDIEEVATTDTSGRSPSKTVGRTDTECGLPSPTGRRRRGTVLSCPPFGAVLQCCGSEAQGVFKGEIV